MLANNLLGRPSLGDKHLQVPQSALDGREACFVGSSAHSPVGNPRIWEELSRSRLVDAEAACTEPKVDVVHALLPLPALLRPTRSARAGFVDAFDLIVGTGDLLICSPAVRRPSSSGTPTGARSGTGGGRV